MHVSAVEVSRERSDGGESWAGLPLRSRWAGASGRLLGSGAFGTFYRSKPAVGWTVTWVFPELAKQLALLGYLLQEGIAESVSRSRGKVSLLLKAVCLKTIHWKTAGQVWSWELPFLEWYMASWLASLLFYSTVFLLCFACPVRDVKTFNWRVGLKCFEVLG